MGMKVVLGIEVRCEKTQMPMQLLPREIETVDELVTIPESMFGTFEGNGKDGPLANGMGTTNVNDEDSGVDLVGLQKTCQPLYPSACSTKLATTMLLMNIYTIHGLTIICR